MAKDVISAHAATEHRCLQSQRYTGRPTTALDSRNHTAARAHKLAEHDLEKLKIDRGPSAVMPRRRRNWLRWTVVALIPIALIAVALRLTGPQPV